MRLTINVTTAHRSSLSARDPAVPELAPNPDTNVSDFATPGRVSTWASETLATISVILVITSWTFS